MIINIIGYKYKTSEQTDETLKFREDQQNVESTSTRCSQGQRISIQMRHLNAGTEIVTANTSAGEDLSAEPRAAVVRP